METEQIPKIRPAYMVGGGLAVVLACLASVACFALVWTISRNAEGDRIATEVAESRQTRIATLTPRAVSSTQVAGTPDALPTRTLAAPPTPLPTVGGPVVSVPTSSGFAPLGDNRAAPPDAVRNYFTLVGEERYDLTWPLLTDAFKQKFNCCAPNYDFAGYMQWWETVDRVEFGRVETLSQSGDRATVYAEIIYIMNAGTRFEDSERYIDLEYDAASGQWRLADKREN